MADIPGQTTASHSRPTDMKDAKARGLQMNGMAAGDSGGSSAGRSSGGGKSDLAAMVQKFVDQEMGDQNDLHSFCEMGRAILHRMAVETHLAAGELTAGAKEMGRQNRQWGAVFKMRRVTKQLEKAAEGMAETASGFVKTWTAFESAFGEIMSSPDKRKPKHFTVKI